MAILVSKESLYFSDLGSKGRELFARRQLPQVFVPQTGLKQPLCPAVVPDNALLGVDEQHGCQLLVAPVFNQVVQLQCHHP